MNIEIRTERYQFAHGKKPRGTGTWAFIGPADEIVWAPDPMTLGQAMDWLKRERRKMDPACRAAVWHVAP